ncbi:hypothetical protein BD779DRAFT_1473161 [Infundibulicybe gibba]|nr:hypothetical protein BD779DRAFT_1473161 [Infundibulicybe gibba]
MINNGLQGHTTPSYVHPSPGSTGDVVILTGGTASPDFAKVLPLTDKRESRRRIGRNNAWVLKLDFALDTFGVSAHRRAPQPHWLFLAVPFRELVLYCSHPNCGPPTQNPVPEEDPAVGMPHGYARANMSENGCWRSHLEKADMKSFSFRIG